MLLPLPEPSFLHLDLLSESFPQELFFLLELGVVELFDLGFTELPGLHLSLTVSFVMRLFGRRDKVEHVNPEQERTEFTEITVVLVVD
jgi:hypothetical protein